MKASVKYKVIYRHREKYSISEMCRFFGVSRSGYYEYVKRMEIPAKDFPLAKRSASARPHASAPMATAEYKSGWRGKEYTTILKRFSES